MSLDLESLLVDKTLLLTGSTGFIGRNFASYLAKTETFQRGRLQVLCASRNKKSLAEIYPLRSGFQHFVWDIETPYLAELNQVDYIVHLAGADRFLDSQNKSAEILSSTSTGTLNMLNLARRAGTSRILLASSGAVYPKCNESPNVFSESEYSSSLYLDSIDPYVAGKRKEEYLCNSYAEETGISVGHVLSDEPFSTIMTSNSYSSNSAITTTSWRANSATHSSSLYAGATTEISFFVFVIWCA
jgi:nucleoside-diphosphate-sugar epimerase